MPLGVLVLNFRARRNRMSANMFFNAVHGLWNAVDWATGGKATDAAKAAHALGHWSKEGVFEFFRSLDTEQQSKIMTLVKVTQSLSAVTQQLSAEVDEKDEKIADLQRQVVAARKALRQEARTTLAQEDEIKNREATIQELFSKLDRVMALQDETEQENAELKEQLQTVEKKLDKAGALINIQKEIIDTDMKARVEAAATDILQPEVEELAATEHLIDEMSHDPTLVRDIKTIFGSDRTTSPRFTPSMQERLATRVQVWMREQKRPFEAKPEEWQSRVEESFSNPNSQVLFAYNYPNMGTFIQDYAKPLFEQMSKTRIEQKEAFVQSLPTKRKDSQTIKPFVDYLVRERENIPSPIVSNEDLQVHMSAWLKSEQKPADISKIDWEKMVDKAFENPKSKELEQYGLSNPSKIIKKHSAEILNQVAGVHVKATQRKVK